MNERDLARPGLKDRAATAVRNPALVAAAVAGLFLAVAVPLILRDAPMPRGGDERSAHIPTIEQFAAQWPRPDVSDYPAPQTPGWHLDMAAVRQYAGAPDRALRIINAVLAAGLFVTLGVAVGRLVSAVTAVLLCLPLLCSPYVIAAGVRLLPDNVGLWGALAVMLVALRRRFGADAYFWGALLLFLTVMVWQWHAWAAAALLAAAWLGTAEPTSIAEVATFPVQQWTARRRIMRLFAMLLAVAPAAATLAWFFDRWQGFVPPTTRATDGGINPAAPGFALAVLGLFGSFFVGFLMPRRAMLRRSRGWIIAGALLGIVAAIVPETNYDVAAGRYSGIWAAVRYVDDLLPPAVRELHRSPLVLLLAAVGGAMVIAWAAALPRRDRWVWLIGWGAFIGSSVIHRSAFQRHVEPVVLVLLIVAAARVLGSPPAERVPDTAPPRWAAAGPALLAIGLAAVTVLGLRA